MIYCKYLCPFTQKKFLFFNTLLLALCPCMDFLYIATIWSLGLGVLIIPCDFHFSGNSGSLFGYYSSGGGSSSEVNTPNPADLPPMCPVHHQVNSPAPPPSHHNAVLQDNNRFSSNPSIPEALEKDVSPQINLLQWTKFSLCFIKFSVTMEEWKRSFSFLFISF